MIPTVPDTTPIPKNSQIRSARPRWSACGTYHKSQHSSASCTGNHNSVIARYQTSSLSGVVGSAFAVSTPSTASSTVNNPQDASGTSAIVHPPCRAASTVTGTSPSDSQNGSARPGRAT